VKGQPLKLSARLLREALDLAKCVAARQVFGGRRRMTDSRDSNPSISGRSTWEEKEGSLMEIRGQLVQGSIEMCHNVDVPLLQGV
jgi:hypothetical protein